MTPKLLIRDKNFYTGKKYKRLYKFDFENDYGCNKNGDVTFLPMLALTQLIIVAVK